MLGEYEDRAGADGAATGAEGAMTGDAAGTGAATTGAGRPGVEARTGSPTAVVRWADAMDASRAATAAAARPDAVTRTRRGMVEGRGL